MTERKFETGMTVMTRGVADKMVEEQDFDSFVVHSLGRHVSGDWGDLGDEDSKLNDQAVIEGSRILSAYETEVMPKIWIITEWDRSVTTVLFPEEY